MADPNIERLGRGLIAAQDKGDLDSARMFGQEIRRLQNEQNTASAGTNNVFSSFGNAFRANVDPVLEGMGTTAEVLGAPGFGQTLKDATSMPEGYESGAAGFHQEGGLTRDWSKLPHFLAEQTGQMAGSLAARGLGAAGGAAVGSLAGPGGAIAGGVAGGIAGPAVFEAAQILGPTAMERARNNGRDTPNEEDLQYAWATAAASGALNSIAPGAQGMIRRAFLEGGTEGLQSLTQQAGETLHTDAGLSLDPDMALTEGIGGIGSMAVVDTAREAADVAAQPIRHAATLANEKLESIRYDTDLTSDDQRAAQRILDAADGDEDILATVASRDPDKRAQGAAKAALGTVREEAAVVVNSLRALARHTRNIEGLEAVNALKASMGSMTSRVPESLVNRVIRAFPDEPSVPRFTSLARQASAIQSFTVGEGDLGGFSSITRRADITDPRANPMATAGVAAALGSTGRLAGAIGTVGSTVLVNRMARQVDIWTNRRSPIKRFVDSARKAGPIPEELTGNATASLDNIKKREAAIQAHNQYLIDSAREQAAEEKKAYKEARRDATEENKHRDKVANAAKAEAARQANLTIAKTATEARDLANANLKLLKERNTAPMFESGVVPAHPYFEPYRKWVEYTGMDPKATVEGLQQLEEAGVIPPGTTERYATDIRSFETKEKKGVKPEVYDIQQALINEFNRDFVYKKPTPTKPQVSPLDRLKQVSELKPTGNNWKFRAVEGQIASINLLSRIEADKDTLSPDAYLDLLHLRREVDDQTVPRDARRELVDQGLSRIFPDSPLQSAWRVHFGHLTAAGNDFAKARTAQDAEANPEAQAEADAEARLTETIKKSKKRKKDKKPKKSPLDPSKAANDNRKPTAKDALQKLLEGPKEPKLLQGPEAFETAPVEAVREAVEPNFDTEAETAKKAKGRTGVATMVTNRVGDLFKAEVMAKEEGPNLLDYMGKLPKSDEGRVEGLIYEMASSRLTMNMIADKFASRFDVPPAEAARAVSTALANMEADGLLERFVPKHGTSALVVDGEMKRGPDGKVLSVIGLTFLDPDMKARIEIAKAVNLRDRMVDQKNLPEPYTPNNLYNGVQRAFKSYSKDTIDATFKPILDFINGLRESQMMVSERMLSQIEDAAASTEGSKNAGTIREVLMPSKEKPTTSGKTKRQTDLGPLRAVAQLIYQLGAKGERVDNRIRQEVMAGDNGRVYMKNGSASSQGADLMKGILRAPVKAPLRDQSGIDFVFHSFGNLLGYDKESPRDRRQSVFKDPGAIDGLVAFAENPFGRSTFVSSAGNEKPIVGIMKHAGGIDDAFFQVLNVANELRDMVNWVRERHPGLKNTPSAELLQNPTVVADLVSYQTDFIAQLDANNNAYQLVGTILGDQSVLQATGVLPREGVNTTADQTRGADIYMAPALAIAERVPELKLLREMGMTDAQLRTLFKGPIGTYLYAAQYSSRKERMAQVLRKLADGADVFGINETGLIEVPPAVVQGLMSPDGYRFVKTSFDENGDVVKETPVRRRVVETEGGFSIETMANRTGEFTRGKLKFASPEEAITETFGNDFYGRMNRELVHDLNTRFPRIREHMNFADVVSKIVKESGQATVKVPTPDGMNLDWSFKESEQYVPAEVTLAEGRVVQMGVRSGESKLKGRGLAAFMAHMLDAYVARESHKRMQGNGGAITFNPIHDSFGFHPSEAARGQETVVSVMQELQTAEYDVYIGILLENGITLEAFSEAGGVLPQRGEVPQVPPSAIPTAVS